MSMMMPAPKPKGTQPGHAITDNSNHTRVVITGTAKTSSNASISGADDMRKAAKKQSEAKRPAVGNDAEAQKKYGSNSWNNGYTN